MKVKVSLTYISILVVIILTNILLLNAPVLANNSINVKVDTVEAKPGDKVEVPVKFSNIPDSGINNCDFILTFDKNVLEVIEIKPGKIVTNPNVNLKSNLNKSGRIAVMFVDETDMVKN